MHFLLLRDALECRTRTKSHFSLVRSRLLYLVYMQLLVFFTLLFRTPYILYIFWIIYISSYTKVHIFFSLRACYGILQFYGQWRRHIIGLNHIWRSIWTQNLQFIIKSMQDWAIMARVRYIFCENPGEIENRYAPPKIIWTHCASCRS